jgi:hypothetical protein
MKTTKLILTLSTTIALLAASGCLGTDPARSAAAPLTESCFGTFACVDADGTFETYDISGEDGDCDVGPYHLYEDGSLSDYTEDEDDLDHWEGDSALFTLCDDESSRCMTCSNITPPTAPSPTDDDAEAATDEEPVGRCDGSAPSCLSQSPGSCSSVDGCYQSSRFRWNGDLEFYCTGVAKRCSAYDTSRSCTRQYGCYWYD